jgi:hypothetical protein
MSRKGMQSIDLPIPMSFAICFVIFHPDTIAHQNAATKAAIRAALERRAEPYQTSVGINLPIAFKIGVGRRSN